MTNNIKCPWDCAEEFDTFDELINHLEDAPMEDVTLKLVTIKLVKIIANKEKQQGTNSIPKEKIQNLIDEISITILMPLKELDETEIGDMIRDWFIGKLKDLLKPSEEETK